MVDARSLCLIMPIPRSEWADQGVCPIKPLPWSFRGRLHHRKTYRRREVNNGQDESA